MACFWGVLAPTSQGRARIAGWCGVGKTLLVDSRNAGEACQGSKAGACGPSRRVRSMLDCITRLKLTDRAFGVRGSGFSVMLQSQAHLSDPNI